MKDLSKKYIIMIEVDEAGQPRWLHDDIAEASLNRPQKETVGFLYQRYQSAKKSWAFLDSIRAKFRALRPLDQDAQRKQMAWTKSAEQTERMLAQGGAR